MRLTCPRTIHGRRSRNGASNTVCRAYWGISTAPETGSSSLGDLVYVNVVGQPIIVVGSAEVAYDLFERRSSKYSGRGHSTMVVELHVHANCFQRCIADVLQDGLGVEFRYDELRRPMEEASQNFPRILRPKCCGQVSAHPDARIPGPPETPHRKP